MDESDYSSDLEKRILKIVERIIKNRNRPCYQNIQTLLNRGDFVIDCTKLNIFIDNLVEKGVLRNVGTAEKESFRLVNSSENDGPSFISSQGEFKNADIFNITEDIFNITDEKMSTNSTSSLNEFINTKFYETLIERIKCEVVKCVQSELSDYDILKIQQAANDPAEANQCKDNRILINKLKNDIEQLWTEQKSKDAKDAINKSFVGNQVQDNDLIINRLNRELEQLRMDLKSKDKVIQMLTNVNDNKNTSDCVSNNYANYKQSHLNHNNRFNKQRNNVADNTINRDNNTMLSDT